MSYQSLIVNAERIAVGSGLQQENIFGMIDHNTHFRFPHFSILYLSFFNSTNLSYVKSQNILLFILVKFTTCFYEKCTKRGISIYADWKCLFFCSLVSFFSSAQEVFNNDVFRLRFRHAERSEFQ